MMETINRLGKPHANVLAELMHPRSLDMKVTKVINENPTMKTYRLEPISDMELPYFYAGQYIPIYVDIEDNRIMRPYAISSSPEESCQGFYEITIKRAVGGYVSNYMMDTFEVGTELSIGAPEGLDYYNPIRDRKKIIGLAGGCGVTLYRSMAKAIVDGTIDCEMTLLYGCNVLEDVAFLEEWKDFEVQSEGKFKCVQVIANEDVEGMERGFITVDLIEKYASIDESTLYIDGPCGMINYMKDLLGPINLRKKYVRYGVHGDSSYVTKEEYADKEFAIKVHQAGNTYDLNVKGAETVHIALERAGLKPPAKCRSGICGACRAYLISGDLSFAEDKNGIRKRDKELGFFHTCCSFPTSDLEIVINRL